MDEIISYISAVLLFAIVISTIITLLYFIVSKLSKGKFDKKYVLKIYVINLFIWAGAFALLIFLPKVSKTQISYFISMLTAAVIFALIIKLAIGKKEEKTVKSLEETKCTCQACGNVWYYGKQEYRENMGLRLINSANQDSNCASDLLCCSGCLPAFFIPRNPHMPIKDLNKCPKCNSSAVKKVQIIHDI